jgi:hypothetical protein
MLAVKRIRLIGDHWDRVLERIARHAEPHCEVWQRAEHIVRHLPEWISGPRENIEERFQEIGGRVFLHGCALDDEIRMLHLIRNEIFNYVGDQAAPVTAVDLYGQEEFAIQLMHAFDAMVVALVRGHQQALREQIRTAA